MFYQHALSETCTFTDFLQVMLHGLKLDCTIAGYLTAIPLLLTLAVRSQLDDTVRYSLYELVVMTGEQDISLECLQRIIEGLDGFQVQVVGRSIQDQAVGVGEHHT